MKMLVRCFSLVMPVLFVVSAGAAGVSMMTTKRDYDLKAKFSEYKTFAWAPLPNTQTVASPEVDKAIRDAADAGLTAKGYKKIAGKAPDVYVIYHISSEQKTDVRYYTDWGFGNAYHSGYGYYTGFPGHPVTYAAVEKYKVGALVLDLVEVRRQQLVWRGVASGDLGTPKQNAAMATAAVQSLLSKFPPVPAPPAR